MWKDAHIVNHQGNVNVNVNQNHSEIAPHTLRMATIKKKRKIKSLGFEILQNWI